MSSPRSSCALAAVASSPHITKGRANWFTGPGYCQLGYMQRTSTSVVAHKAGRVERGTRPQTGRGAKCLVQRCNAGGCLRVASPERPHSTSEAQTELTEYLGGFHSNLFGRLLRTVTPEKDAAVRRGYACNAHMHSPACGASENRSEKGDRTEQVRSRGRPKAYSEALPAVATNLMGPGVRERGWVGLLRVGYGIGRTSGVIV
jgi:hypothetical protein